MAGFPQANRVNFFAAVDRWQVAFIVQEATKTKETTTSHEVSENGITLASLSVSIAQLLFSEPSLLDIPESKQIIDATVSVTSSPSLSNVTSLGITPLLVRLLRSPVSPVRKWARTLLPTAGRRKLSFEIFVKTGVRDEVEALCGDSERETAISDSWEIMADILRGGCLSNEAIERGLLRGETIGAKKSSSRGIMAVLTTRMGTESNGAPASCHPDANPQSSPICCRCSPFCSTQSPIVRSGILILLPSFLTHFSPISRTILPSRLF